MKSKGSTWSKWDLHIHTPLSIENGYGGDTDEVWEKFIQSQEALPKEVEVIGINDYYFIDGFEKVMDYKMNQGRLSNIKKIFPVLEFRIDTFASASETKFQKVNLHILFDINYSEWASEINAIKSEFIQQIKPSSLDEHKTKTLSKESLIAIGGNLKTGFKECIPSTKDVFDLLKLDRWRDKVFLFLGYKEWNNVDKGNQLKQTKQSLVDSVDALFTASPQSDITNKQTIIDRFGKKVLIHSNDIHNLSELSEQQYSCWTWVKADPTFDGLKQVIYEPDERIKIQRNSPYFDEQKTIVLENAHFQNSKGWFENGELPLNSGLVSIIGEKGSGKTALLDILAITNGEGIFENDVKNPYSFYNRARKEIQGIEVGLDFQGSDEQQSVMLDGNTAPNETDPYAKVRYLSLRELESYSEHREKFQSFIKQIIYSYNQTLGDFSRKAEDPINKIKEINREIASLENQYGKLNDTRKALQEKRSQLDIHIENEPAVETILTEKEQEVYKDHLQKEQVMIKEVKEAKDALEEIIEFEKWLDSELKTNISNFQDKIESEIHKLKFHDTSSLDFIQLQFNIVGLDEFKKIKSKYETDADESGELIEKVRKEIKPLEDANKAYSKEQENTKVWIERKNELETQIDGLNKKKAKLEATSDRIKELHEKRKNQYHKLLELKIEQREYYEQIKQDLAETDSIVFKVKVEFNEQKFLDKEDGIIRHNIGNSKETIIEELKTNIFDYVNKINNVSSEELDDVLEFISKVEDPQFITKVFGENRNPSNLFKKSFSLQDYYDWLFDDYFEVNYFIYFKGKPLQTLSPGQKGLVLMKVFLRLDGSSKPLLIDQPEDNLDNKSVYNDLVYDLREIKKKRQIIIATHNPNLVVNTDSEQVVVANFEDQADSDKPKIKYKTGSLENKQIRDLVCDILEGGDTAFLKRERKYNLKG